MSIEAELEHIAGVGVVVRRRYADSKNKGQAKVYTSLPTADDLAMWEEAAFTNGGTLVKIELVYDPAQAAALTKSTPST